MPEYRLKIIIEGEDRASNAVKQSSMSLSGLVKKVQALAGVAIAAKLTKDLVEMGTAAALVAARVREMTGVAQMLGQRAGLTADEVTQQIDAIKGLGITTTVATDLLSKFSKNSLDMAQATDLARVAQDAAVLSGEDSSQALAGLMHGIETYNVEVLRTRGLNIQMEKAFKDYAITLGKTADDLTTTEKSQAALNAALGAGTAIAGTYEKAMEEPGKRIRSLARYHEEAQRVIGDAFVPALGAYADGMKQMYQVVLDNEAAFQRLLKPLGDAAAGVIKFGTGLGEMALKSIAAASDLGATNDRIIAMGENMLEAEARSRSLVATFIVGYKALQDAGDIQAGIAEKMERTVAAAEYMSRNVPEAYAELQAAAAEYADEVARVDRIGLDGMARTTELGPAMLTYNQAVWALAQANGIAADSFYELLDAERTEASAATAAEAARWKLTQANMQAGTTGRSLRSVIQEEADAYYRVAGAADRAALAARRYANATVGGSKNIQRQAWVAEQVAAYDAAHPADGGGGGESPQARWERERVTSARRAALEIRYWEQDQQEWIADNQATLTADLQAEFAERTAAAQAEADALKETDAQLARDLLDAESQYQQEKAAIATDESLSDEERAAKLAILEREQAETIERAKETAALNAQIREEDRQRELAQARATGQATGQAMAEEFGKIFDEKMLKMRGKWDDLGEGARQAGEKGKPTWETFLGGMLGQQDTATSEWDLTQQEAVRAAALAKSVWDPFMANLLQQQQQFTAGWQGAGTPPQQSGFAFGWGGGNRQGGGSINAPMGVPVPIIAHGGEEYRPKGHPPAPGGLTVNVYGNVVNSADSTDPGNIAWTIDSELAMRGVRV